MSSYLMDSNYIDPKFPPCEEYSQNSYIPEHSPEYYSRTRDTVYQHHHQELYPPRVTYQERPYNCVSIPEPEPQTGHGLTHSGNLLAGKAHTSPCEPLPLLPTSPTTPPIAPPACIQAAPEQPTSSALAKQPVVYPWMKKIHVSIGRQSVLLFSLLALPTSRALSSPLSPLFYLYRLAYNRLVLRTLREQPL